MRPLRVLIVEDSEDDTLLLLRELRRGGYDPAYERVDTAGAMQAALARQSWDVILADFSLPHFSAPAALSLMQASELDLPFIIVSGTVGEETAVAAMKAGAHDYLMKGNLSRLVPAIEREWREAQVRQERKLAEDRLHASEKRFRALIENAPDGITLLSPEGTLQYVSPSTSRILGYSSEELVGRDPIELIHPDDQEYTTGLLLDLIQKPGDIFTVQYRVQHQDGSWRWIETTINNLLAEPSVQGIVFNYRDITQHKQAEAAEERHREELRQTAAELCFSNDLIEQTTQPMAVADLQGHLVRFNRAFEQLMGYNSQELLKMTYQQVTPERWHDMEAQQIAQLMATGQAVHYEKEYRRKDGVLVSVELVTDIYRNAAGKPEYLYGFVTDITQRKQAEAEIRRRNRELSLLNEIITASAAGREPEAVLEIACRELAKTFDLPQVVALLLNEEKTSSAVIAEYRADNQPMALHATFPVQRNPVFQYLLTHLAPLAVEDARNDPRLEPNHDFLCQLGVASLLLVPLSINEEVVGSLGLITTELHRFSALEVSLAWNVADQVAGALARYRLAQTRRHLIIAIEQAAESVVIADTDGLIIYVNPAFEQISGYSSAEAIGQELCWLKSEHQDDTLYRDLWLTISSGQVWRGRFINKKKDGSLFTEEVTISPVRNDTGTIINYVAVKRDVTRELQLEKRYQRVISSISDHVYMTEITADGRYLNRYLSPVEKLTGYPQERFEDWQFWSSTVIHPDDRSFAAGQAARLAAGQDGEIEYRLVRADGQIIWVRDSARVEVEGPSKIIFGVVSDITGRKQAEETLKQRAAQLALLNEIGGQIAAVLELDGVLNRAAHLVQQTFDYHHVALFLLGGELKLRAVAGAYRDKFPPGHTQKLSEGINGWVARHGKKVISNDVSGEPRFISLIGEGGTTHSELCLPIKVAGHVVGVLDIQSPRLNAFTENEVVAMEMFTNQIAVAIENDRLYGAVQQELNERTRAEAALAEERASLARRVEERTAELRIANAELAHVARLKDEFLANMSHELRTPLNTILGMADVLRLNVYGPLTEEQVKALGYIEESGQHLLALINDILDLSKIEAGKIDLQIDAVHVPDVCQASLLFIRQIAQKKEIVISSRLDEAVKTVQADERRLKQILVNLLTNAVKFTPEGGQVGLEVTGDQDQGVVHFIVWDTGIGISREDMKRLFKPFVQIDSSLARQHEGTGLGLALVYRLAEMHGGSVKLESDGVPGQGSHFTVSLPWRQPEIQKAKAGPAQIVIPPGSPPILDAGNSGADSLPLILLAEDSETTIILLQDFLGMNGYRVTVARNGAEAIEQAGEERPHLILMDVQMPGMDGLEAIRRIRTDAALADIPIVALTALAMPGDRERCLQAGATEYLSKPVRLSRLAEVIQAQIQVGT